MGAFLHKLGAYGFKHKWQMLLGWLVIMVILGLVAAHFIKPTSSAISIPGTESQKALDRVGELFPEAGKGSGRLVFQAPAGKKLSDYQAQITAALADAAKVPDVAQVISPFDNTRQISGDGTIGYAQLQLKNGNGSVSDTTIKGVEEVAAGARQNNLTVEMGGDVINKAPKDILGMGEVAGVVIALVVLVITLGSLVSAGMPIAIALVTIGVSMAGLFGLSQVIDISATTPVLAVMLGLAVGIDYSLFIISKYRSYLLEGYEHKTAAAKAIGTAGNAVIFAAATVVIALSALSVVQIPFMTTMGLAGAATVALAAIVAVTFIPALLGFAGDRIFGGKTKRAIKQAQAKGPHDSHKVSHKTIWYKWGAAITKRPVTILVLAVALIAVIALPARNLVLGLPTDEYAAKSTTQAKAYELLGQGFGPGFNGPLLAVVEGLPAVSDQDRQLVRASIMEKYNTEVANQAAQQKVQFEQRAASVASPEQYVALQQDVATAEAKGRAAQQSFMAGLDQQVEQYSKLRQLSLVADNISKINNVQQALPALATDDGTKGMIQIIPKSAPSDKATAELITYLRDTSKQETLASGSSISLAITGSTALETDINNKLASALPQYLAVVVGLSLILLIIAFRSILVPIKATLGFLLSVLAMFGALVAVFQWGWLGIAEAPGPIVSFIPIISIGILFGLAMDYEFFLVSSMHEAYSRDKDAKKAVVNGFGLGSKVVTAAGVIMVAVFAGFIFNHDTTIQAIGFGLAVGILVDAFIVRMTIVPAVMSLLGKHAWWLPKWLDRAVPHISIEGEEEKRK